MTASNPLKLALPAARTEPPDLNMPDWTVSGTSSPSRRILKLTKL